MRTFTEFVRQLDAPSLTTLLTLRPDLGVPRAHDLAELAGRAATDASIRRALDELDVWLRQVAEALAALDDPASLEALTGLLGVQSQTVVTAVGELRARALVWGEDDALHLVRGVRTAFEPWPCGLAPPSPQPLSSAEVRAALHEVGETGAAVLARLQWGPPTGTVRNAERRTTVAQARTPVEHLLARGLLRPYGPDTVLLPREVALQLRGGLTREPIRSTAPPRSGEPRPSRLVANAAVGAAVELVEDVELVIENLSSARPGLLRDGGLPARELSALVRQHHLDPARASFLVELAWQGDLLTSFQSAIAATSAYDDWLGLEPAERWVALARAWTEAERWFATARDLRTLGPEAVARWAPYARSAVLTEFELPMPLRHDELSARLAWYRPALTRFHPAEHLVGEVLREASWLGLAALDCPSLLAPVARGRALPDQARELFPEPVDRFWLQADLTAVAPGPLTHQSASRLRLLAEQESRGGASVFRFSAASIRRGFDAGLDAPEILSWLREHSSTAVPQPLAYLISDVSRHFGAIRVGQAASYLRFDDPTQSAAVLAHPEAAVLGLRELAPGVLIAEADADEVVTMLRAAGLAPAAEDATGRALTAPAPPRPGTGRSIAPERPDPERMAAELLRTEAQLRLRSEGTQSTLDALSQALRDATPIEINYVGDDGTRACRMLVPVTMAAGMVRLVDPAGGRSLAVPLARITSAFAPQR